MYLITVPQSHTFGFEKTASRKTKSSREHFHAAIHYQHFPIRRAWGLTCSRERKRSPPKKPGVFSRARRSKSTGTLETADWRDNRGSFVHVAKRRPASDSAQMNDHGRKWARRPPAAQQRRVAESEAEKYHAARLWDRHLP